ncbi:hypothetical protein SLA2020_461810 [Shorea laevis]
MAKSSLEIINLCLKSLPRVFWLIILADADSIASLPRRRHRRGGAQLCDESRGRPTRFRRPVAEPTTETGANLFLPGTTAPILPSAFSYPLFSACCCDQLECVNP